MQSSRVVVVEDDEGTAKFLRVVLESAGFDVAVAVMAVEALGKIEEHDPALIVTDVRMPGASGITLLEHLRSTPGTRDVPVLVYTSLRDDETRAAVEATPRAELVIKPAEPTRIVAVARHLLAQG